MKKVKISQLLTPLILFCVCVSLSLDAEDFNREIFQNRRQKLMEKMEGGIAILRSAGNMSDFYYLTGLFQQNAAILLIPEGKEKYILFIQPTSASRELWTGKRPGLDEAEKVFGADRSYPIEEFDRTLSRYLRGQPKVFVSFRDRELYDKIIPMIRNPFGTDPVPVLDPRPYIHEMRLIKDAEEIKLMRKAADITSESLIEVMKAVRPGMFEYEVEAIIEYIFRKNGAYGPGFPSIVGSGANSTMLHYEDNNRQTQDGDLLLMDVGADYSRYTADVTRTIPVNGTFSTEQRDIYEVVLKAQKEAIKIAAPGVGIYEINTRGVEVIKEGLHRLGLITDKNSTWQHRAWLMYNISHWVGLDVHDVGGRGPNDGKGRSLEPGMVFTVEPGLYIREETLKTLPEMFSRFGPKKEELDDFISAVRPAVQKYMNIGVRVEDDILITQTGHEIISLKVPKDIAAIEKLMKKKSYLNRSQ